MTHQSPVNYPLFAQRDATDAAKFSSPSTTKTSLYESESPLGAHSSTTSSRLSGSYEPSQVSSMMDELNSDLAQMQTNESATYTNNASQRPYLPQLILPSNMPPNQGHANPIHAPYSNFQSYPMMRQHPGYSYGPIYTPTEQHPGMSAQPPFPSSVHYNSPPTAHSAPHAHQHMPRRTSVGLYQYAYYEYGNTPLSPVSPYGYQQHTVNPLVMMPAQQYPASPPLVAAPATRQVRPLVSSPLRPLEAANSWNTGNNSHRQGTALFSSAPPLGHQASLSVNRAQRRDQRGGQMQQQTPISADFKNHKYKKLRDIKGRVVEASKDQYGSRFIQQQFDHASPEDKQMIFEEIVPKQALHLMTDVFGNYVIQKQLEHGTLLQRQELCNVMKGNILLLSLDVYGCRVVQKAVDCGSAQQQSAIVSELNGHILQCVKSSNGNHVIQKLLESVELERNTFIYAFTDNVYALATNPYGCRVLQRCFQFASQEQIEPLLEELHACAYELMQDQFGNYVVQFVLEHGKPADRQRLVDSVLGRILLLSRHKYASNVCEKAIAAADDARKWPIVEEMLIPGSDGVIPVSLMMRDQFANYVLQKALKSVEGPLWDALLDAVLRALIIYRRQPGSHNSKQLTSIERLLKEKGVAPEKLVTPRLVVPIPAAQADPNSGSPTP